MQLVLIDICRKRSVVNYIGVGGLVCDGRGDLERHIRHHWCERLPSSSWLFILLTGGGGDDGRGEGSLLLRGLNVIMIARMMRTHAKGGLVGLASFIGKCDRGIRKAVEARRVATPETAAATFWTVGAVCQIDKVALAAGQRRGGRSPGY